MKALVVGEALVDVVTRPGQDPEVFPGGSPANVALGLARLGRPVDLLTRIGQDTDGALVRDHLEASGVRLVPGSQVPGATSRATAHIAADGSASYDFDLTIAYPDLAPDPATAVIHLGSIGAVLEPGATTLRSLLAQNAGAAVITYDPNLRPSIMGSPEDVRRQVLDLVALSDVVKVSDEDAAWLLPGRDPVQAARDWAGAGPALVVLTQGGEGATAITSSGAEVSIPALPVQVADTVGAGDSFMSGLIDGLWSAGLLQSRAIADLSTASLLTLLNHCARIAAITVSRPGANPPTRLELLTPSETA